MRKVLTVMFVVSFLLVSFQAIGSEAEGRIRAQADAALDIFIKQKFDTYVDFIYPRVIDIAGGRQEFLYNIQDQMDLLAKHKMKILSHKIVSVSAPVEAGDELHSVVKYTVLMSSPAGKVNSREYFVASSNDGGKQWKLVEGTFLSRTEANNVFPSFNAALELPAESSLSIRLNRVDKVQNNRQLINLDAYLKLPTEAQEFYVAGLADAFIFLSNKTGYMDGLEKCFVDTKATASGVAKVMKTVMESWVKKQPGRSIEIAKLYARAHKKSCAKFID